MELALVVGTIGILAALAISGVGRYRERALKASAIATMRTIATNLSGMLAATGRLPDSLAEMVNAIARPGDYVVCLGAGNITAWAHALPGQLQALQARTPNLRRLAAGGGTQ